MHFNISSVYFCQLHVATLKWSCIVLRLSQIPYLVQTPRRWLSLSLLNHTAWVVSGVKITVSHSSMFLCSSAWILGPLSSVGSGQDLITGDHWFDPSSAISFWAIMTVIATRFIPLLLLTIVLTMLCGKAASGLKRKLCELVKRGSCKSWIGAMAAAIITL